MCEAGQAGRWPEPSGGLLWAATARQALCWPRSRGLSPGCSLLLAGHWATVPSEALSACHLAAQPRAANSEV